MNTYNPNKALGARRRHQDFQAARRRDAIDTPDLGGESHRRVIYATRRRSGPCPPTYRGGTTTKAHRNLDEIERFFSADAARGIVLFRQTGHGPAALNPDKSFDQHGCDIFLKFTEGKLAHYLSSYDIVGMLEQLGALPARGGRLGGAFVLSLLAAKPQ
jgi:hypothetical protein